MKYFLVFFFLILLTSCDGVQEASGMIVDLETKKPLDKVAIKIAEGDLIYSDKNGYFELFRVTGFAFSNNDLTVILSKDNYETDTITIKNGDDKLIKMSRVE